MRIFIVAVLQFASIAWADDWTVDFSRRFKEPPPKTESTSPQPPETGDKSIFDSIFSRSTNDDVVQEIVILQTEKGFVPSKVQVRQGQSYKLDIVNVNEKEKNVSFILDAFSEHHATYYGKIKSFVIRPQQDGIYTYQSPETAFQGQLVVLPSGNPPAHEDVKPALPPEPVAPEVRAPAAEE